MVQRRSNKHAINDRYVAPYARCVPWGWPGPEPQTLSQCGGMQSECNPPPSPRAEQHPGDPWVVGWLTLDSDREAPLSPCCIFAAVLGCVVLLLCCVQPGITSGEGKVQWVGAPGISIGGVFPTPQGNMPVTVGHSRASCIFVKHHVDAFCLGRCEGVETDDGAPMLCRHPDKNGPHTEMCCLALLTVQQPPPPLAISMSGHLTGHPCTPRTKSVRRRRRCPSLPAQKALC